MNRNIFAVCDLEAEYASNFMNYLNQKRNIPFEIQAFSSAQALIEYAREIPIELLLISSRAMIPEVRNLEIGQIIILSEGNHVPGLDIYPSVYKYQATSDVVREVLSCYGEEKSYLPAAYPVMKKSTKIYGIYSPVGRCLKTSLALTLGQLLAKKKAVLYLNLEGFSGLEDLMGKTFSHTLSDLFYYLKQENSSLTLRMNSMIQTVNGLDYIPPVQTPADIQSVVWEDMERMIQEITLHTSYEILILDIGNEMQDIFPLLDRCDKVYMPVLEDSVSQGKIRQYENLLKIWDYAQILTKTEKLHLPSHMVHLSRENYVEQLMFSELASYVKGLLL